MLKPILVQNKSCLLMEYSSGFLRVKASNYELEVRPRTITIKGCLSVKVTTIDRGRKRGIYVSHTFLQLFDGEQCRSVPATEMNTGEFAIKATSTPLGNYVTIMMPGAFLADYIVISEDTTYIQIPGGRGAYSEAANEYCTIYVV
ncbi:MAG: hypothetical protein QXP68_01805 [Thermosphaera sp.]